jgi:septum formation topological specificity factor MinE
MSENNTDNSVPLDASNKLRRELLSVIKRYGNESDVTFYQVLGTLEVVKSDIISWLEDRK